MAEQGCTEARVAHTPKVIPLETPQVRFAGTRLLAFQQFQGPCQVLLFDRVQGQVDLRAVKIPAGEQFAYLRTGALFFRRRLVG